MRLFKRKKPETLGELIETRNLKEILERGFLKELLKEAEKNEKAFFLLLRVASENSEAQKAVNDITRSGANFALSGITREEITLPPLEKINLLFKEIDRAEKPVDLSHRHYQEMCENDLEAKKALVSFYLTRAKKIVEDRENNPFQNSFEMDYEMSNITRYLLEIPVPEVQEFFETSKLFLKYSEKIGSQ
ncbi:MAG: hypothetical protein P1P85_02965 [Patescibacteria group bacterium]|nr:hypothetical protein [Patescibacteria group bacterium]